MSDNNEIEKKLTEKIDAAIERLDAVLKIMGEIKTSITFWRRPDFRGSKHKAELILQALQEKGPMNQIEIGKTIGANPGPRNGYTGVTQTLNYLRKIGRVESIDAGDYYVYGVKEQK